MLSSNLNQKTNFKICFTVRSVALIQSNYSHHSLFVWKQIENKVKFRRWAYSLKLTRNENKEKQTAFWAQHAMVLLLLWQHDKWVNFYEKIYMHTTISLLNTCISQKYIIIGNTDFVLNCLLTTILHWVINYSCCING